MCVYLFKPFHDRCPDTAAACGMFGPISNLAHTACCDTSCAGGVSIGGWSSFERDISKRQIPVKVTFSADVPRTEFRFNIHEFNSEQECLDAMTKQPDPKIQ